VSIFSQIFPKDEKKAIFSPKGKGDLTDGCVQKGERVIFGQKTKESQFWKLDLRQFCNSTLFGVKVSPPSMAMVSAEVCKKIVGLLF
jgi:hypothetical protein